MLRFQVKEEGVQQCEGLDRGLGKKKLGNGEPPNATISSGAGGGRSSNYLGGGSRRWTKGIQEIPKQRAQKKREGGGGNSHKNRETKAQILGRLNGKRAAVFLYPTQRARTLN